MTEHAEPRGTRPTQAIDARRRDAAAKLAAVRKAVKAIGRAGTPISRADVARLSGVSRSFTYQNEDANTLITDAQTRTLARPIGSIHAVTAQQEASWRERALNAEDRARHLNHERAQQRQLVADLLGQLRDPDGTWLEDDRTRLRDENQRLLHERNQLLATQRDLHRKLDGARANVTRLTTARVTELFPNGPGPHVAG
jgi:hypothetical protein